MKTVKIEHIIDEDGVENKRCSNCTKYYPLDHFGKNKALWDGLSSRCKECRNLLAKNEYDPSYHQDRYAWIRSSPVETYKRLSNIQRDTIKLKMKGEELTCQIRTLQSLINRGIFKYHDTEIYFTKFGIEVAKVLYEEADHKI
jgi:hypothetical protein